MGLPISKVTSTEAITAVDQMIQSGGVHQVATVNLDFVRNARRLPLLQRVICDCSLVVADGAPIVWASKLAGKSLPGRVTGVDLVPELCRLSAEKGYGIFLLGSSDESAQRAMKVLEARFPGVRFVGQYAPPPADLARMDDEEILARIHAAQPQILLVAFGNPKQELWLARVREQLQVPVSVGIGGSLEMIGGQLKRAPKWVQAMQMEWVYRMAQEPARLLPRYWHDLQALMRYLPSEMFARTRQPKNEWLSGFSVEQTHSAMKVDTPATLTGYACKWLQLEAHRAVEQGNELIVDMQATYRLEADGLGCLLELRRQFAQARLSISMENVTEPVVRLLRSTGLEVIVPMTAAGSVAAVPAGGLSTAGTARFNEVGQG